MRRTWTKLGLLTLVSAAIVSGCARMESSGQIAKSEATKSQHDAKETASLKEPKLFRPPQYTDIRPIEEAGELLRVQATSNDERDQSSPPSVLKRPTSKATPLRRAPDGDLDAVTAKAQQLIRQAYSLADRGALYTARSDLMTALQGLCEATDTKNGDRRCTEALREGMTALEEAADFVVNGDLRADLKSIVAGHRTPVLKSAKLEQITSILAMQKYYTFAQKKFVEAGNEMPAASEAFCGLGKVTRHLPAEDSGAKRNALVKALVLQQSAASIWEGNYHAKNELGVLYTLLKRPETAKPLLHEVAVATNWPSAWANLAEVHAQLKENDLAEAAMNEARVAQESTQQKGYVKRGALEFQWVTPEQFAEASGEMSPASVAKRSSATPRR